MWNIVFILFFSLLLFMGGSIIFGSLKSGISPMPTCFRVKKRLLEIPANIEQGAILYELGCGWGTLAFKFADKYPSCHLKAFEISLIPYLFCRCRNYFSPRKNLHFYYKNFLNVSFADASLVICYLYPGAMEKLERKFQQELPSGSLVFSNTFAIPNKKPRETIEVQDLYRTKIYIYEF